MSEIKWLKLLSEIKNQEYPDEHLSLSACGLHLECDIEDLVDALNQSPKIKSLYLSWNPNLSQQCYITLAKLSHVKSIKLRNNAMHPEVTRAFENSQFEALDICSNKLDDVSMEPLAKMPNLRSLHLGRTKITDNGLMYFKDNQTLKILNLALNHIGLDGLDILVDLQLEELELSGNAIGDVGAEILAKKNRTIKKLDLSNCRITDTGVCHLAANPIFEALNLTRNKISNESAIALSESPSLVNLSLCYTQISDLGVEALANSSLEYLNIAGNPMLNKNCISSFLNNRSLLNLEHSLGKFDPLTRAIHAHVTLNAERRKRLAFLSGFKQFCSRHAYPLIEYGLIHEINNISGFPSEKKLEKQDEAIKQKFLRG